MVQNLEVGGERKRPPCLESVAKKPASNRVNTPMYFDVPGDSRSNVINLFIGLAGLRLSKFVPHDQLFSPRSSYPFCSVSYYIKWILLLGYIDWLDQAYRI